MKKQLICACLTLGGLVALPAVAQDDAAAGAAGAAGAAAAAAGTVQAPAGEKSSVQLADEKQRLSYAVGVQIGNSVKDLPMEIDMEVFRNAIEDVLQDRQLALTQQELMKEMQSLQATLREKTQEMRKQQQAEAAEKGAANQKQEAEFLAANAKKEGVKTTESGLQYVVLQEGDGPQPKATDTVTVNYQGTLLDGTEFDASANHGGPATFGLNQVIPGWTEGVQLMKKGAKYKFFVPAKLAYGENAPPGSPIGPNSMLIFEVELIDIKGAEGAEEPAGAAGAAQGAEETVTIN